MGKSSRIVLTLVVVLFIAVAYVVYVPFGIGYALFDKKRIREFVIGCADAIIGIYGRINKLSDE